MNFWRAVWNAYMIIASGVCALWIVAVVVQSVIAVRSLIRARRAYRRHMRRLILGDC